MEKQRAIEEDYGFLFSKLDNQVSDNFFLNQWKSPHEQNFHKQDNDDAMHRLSPYTVCTLVDSWLLIPAIA
jgi:endo-beta-N-acetylglucosaminidase D